MNVLIIVKLNIIIHQLPIVCTKATVDNVMVINLYDVRNEYISIP